MFENRDYTVYDDEGNAYVFPFNKCYRALLYGWWVWFISFWIGLFFFNKYLVWVMYDTSCWRNKLIQTPRC